MVIPVALLYGTAKLATLTGGSVEKVKKNFVRFGMNVTRGDLAFAPASFVQMLQYIIIVIGMIGSIYTAYRIGNKGSFKALAQYYVLMVLLAVANIYLFSLPMMHRV